MFGSGLSLRINRSIPARIPRRARLRCFSEATFFDREVVGSSGDGRRILRICKTSYGLGFTNVNVRALWRLTDLTSRDLNRHVEPARQCTARVYRAAGQGYRESVWGPGAKPLGGREAAAGVWGEAPILTCKDANKCHQQLQIRWQNQAQQRFRTFLSQVCLVPYQHDLTRIRKQLVLKQRDQGVAALLCHGAILSSPSL